MLTFKRFSLLNLSTCILVTLNVTTASASQACESLVGTTWKNTSPILLIPKDDHTLPKKTVDISFTLGKEFAKGDERYDAILNNHKASATCINYGRATELTVFYTSETGASFSVDMNQGYIYNNPPKQMTSDKVLWNFDNSNYYTMNLNTFQESN
jgi:hypothetical protein